MSVNWKAQTVELSIRESTQVRTALSLLSVDSTETQRQTVLMMASSTLCRLLILLGAGVEVRSGGAAVHGPLWKSVWSDESVESLFSVCHRVADIDARVARGIYQDQEQLIQMVEGVLDDLDALRELKTRRARLLRKTLLKQDILVRVEGARRHLSAFHTVSAPVQEGKASHARGTVVEVATITSVRDKNALAIVLPPSTMIEPFELVPTFGEEAARLWSGNKVGVLASAILVLVGATGIASLVGNVAVTAVIGVIIWIAALFALDKRDMERMARAAFCSLRFFLRQ